MLFQSPYSHCCSEQQLNLSAVPTMLKRNHGFTKSQERKLTWEHLQELLSYRQIPPSCAWNRWSYLIPVRISPRKDRQRSALRKTAGQNGAMFRVQSSTTIFDEAKPGCLPNKDR